MLAVCSRTFSSIAVNKLFAVYFGGAGLTLLSHLQNLIGMVTHVPDMGINKGLVRFLSDPKNASEKKRKSLVGTGILLIAIFGLLTLALIFLLNGFFLVRFSAYQIKGWHIVAFILSVFLILMNAFFLSVIQAKQQFGVLAWVAFLAALCLLPAVSLGVMSGSLVNGLLSFAIGYAFSSIFPFIFLLNEDRRFFVRIKVSAKTIKSLMGFVWMSLGVLFFGKLVDFYVRDYAIAFYGYEPTGLWQALVRLSSNIRALFIGVVGTVLYPQISKYVTSSDRLSQYLVQNYKLIVPIILLGLGGIYLLKHQVILWLFSKDFLPASTVLHYELTGDFFALLSFPLGYVIMAQLRVKEFVAVEGFSALVYLISIYAFTQYFDWTGLVMAHAVRYFCYFVVLLGLNRKTIFR